MTVALYMDHNVIRAVVEGCRAAGLDVLTAFEDDWHTRSDVELLKRAGALRRIVFTQDTDFIVLATERQACGIPFPGVIFGKHGSMPIRKVIDDLTLICHTLAAEEVANQLIWLPL